MGAPPRTAPPGAPILSRMAEDSTGSDERTNTGALRDAPQFEGDIRPDSATAKLANAIIRIPTRLFELGDYLAKLTMVVQDAFARVAWANYVGASNIAATTISGTTTAFVLALPPNPGTRVHVRNLFVGCSAAHILQLVASKTDATAFAAGVAPSRVLSTVRLVNVLSAWVPEEFWLEPGEALYVVDLSAVGSNLDAALEYRLLSGLG